MTTITVAQRPVSGAAPSAAPSSQAPAEDPRSAGTLLAAARAHARNSSPEMIALKQTLTKAGETVGSHQQWAALQTQLSNCIPTDERGAKWHLALSANITLADAAAAKGDDTNYQLAMRRLWTAMSLIDL